ncbi:MAG: DUF1830 domain-containing protein [Leptolyngbya sp. SIO1D8]|nr:DUF1830 domain-containing protein [Leptolyngbya sp. SIO1D8]
MNNVLDPLPQGSSGHITCYYVNRAEGLQIVRIANVPGWYFERVVFPGQRLIFHALPEALLEIHGSEIATSILIDQIPCTRLRCIEPTQLPEVNVRIEAAHLA